MPLAFRIQINRVQEEVEHLLNSPLIETAFSDGQEVEITLTVWTRPAPDSDFESRIEYRKEIEGATE